MLCVFVCVCVGGGVAAAEGLVSVKLSSSSCMSDWPRLRRSEEERIEGGDTHSVSSQPGEQKSIEHQSLG